MTKRNYYQIRNQRAKDLGFRSYAEQRKVRKEIDQLNITDKAKAYIKSSFTRKEHDRVLGARRIRDSSLDAEQEWRRLTNAVEHDADAQWAAFRAGYRKKGK